MDNYERLKTLFVVLGVSAILDEYDGGKINRYTYTDDELEFIDKEFDKLGEIYSDEEIISIGKEIVIENINLLLKNK